MVCCIQSLLFLIRSSSILCHHFFKISLSSNFMRILCVLPLGHQLHLLIHCLSLSHLPVDASLSYHNMSQDLFQKSFRFSISTLIHRFTIGVYARKYWCYHGKSPLYISWRLLKQLDWTFMIIYRSYLEPIIN